MPLEKVASAEANAAGRPRGVEVPLPTPMVVATALAPLPSGEAPVRDKVHVDRVAPLRDREPPHVAEVPLGHLNLSVGPLLDASDVHDLKTHGGQAPTQSSSNGTVSASTSLPLVDPPDADTDRKKTFIPGDPVADKNVDDLDAESNATYRGGGTTAVPDTGACFDMASDKYTPADAADADDDLHAASEPNDQTRQVADGGDGGDGDNVNIPANGDHGDRHNNVKECDSDDGSHRVKRQRMTMPKDDEESELCSMPTKEIDTSQRVPTPCLHISGYGADPAPEPADTRDAHYTDQQLCGERPLCDQQRLAGHTNAATAQKTMMEIEEDKAINEKCERGTAGKRDNNRAPHATITAAHKPDAGLASPACIVYSAPPADERRADHRRRAPGPSVQVSACGRVIDRPVPRETVLVGPWSLPPQAEADWAGGGGGDTNPTRTAVRFWLTRPVESVRVIGAPCEFCLAVGGALIEPHSQGGVLEMGDVCDTECRPSRMPAGVAGDRLNRALRAVRSARINGQAIAPGVLDLGGIETALVFRGPLDRDTLDRMVVRFTAYNVWRECRSADGKTIADGRWLYGS